jgi:hypothetical protein
MKGNYIFFETIVPNIEQCSTTCILFHIKHMSREHVEHIKYGVTHAKRITKIEIGEWGEKLTGTNTMQSSGCLFVCLLRVHDPLDPVGKNLLLCS